MRAAIEMVLSMKSLITDFILINFFFSFLALVEIFTFGGQPGIFV